MESWRHKFLGFCHDSKNEMLDSILTVKLLLEISLVCLLFMCFVFQNIKLIVWERIDVEDNDHEQVMPPT